MDQFTNLGPVAALIKLWNQLTAPQRVVVTAFAILSAIMLAIGVSSMSKPHMTVLYPGLAPDDAGAITQKLDELKVPWESSDGGTTISVPDSKADEIRMQMATEGLPQGGSTGFELFDKTNFGMTEFGEKTTYQRAIQGELQRIICQLSPVVAAKVLVKMPEESIYASDQEPSSASVVLKLRRGMPLSDEQVGGIVHLVSSAVKGLKPNMVTVLDSDSNVLAEGPQVASGSGGGLMTSNQAKLKRQYESELAQNIQSMLVKALGPDKTVVRVNMDLDFNQEQVKEENFVPATANAAVPGAAPGAATAAEAKGVLLSQQTTKEEYNGAVTPMGGATGKITVGKTTGNPNDSYIRSESSAEYGVTKTVKETVNAPGQVTRRSVAVLVDEKVPVSKIGVIKEIVRTAAGIDETKKDQITVQQIKFDDSAEKAAAAEMASVSKTGMMTAIAKNAGAAVLLVLFLFFLKKTIKQIKVQVPAPVPVAAQQTPADLLAGTNPADLLAMMKQQGYSPDSNEQSGAKYSTLVKPDNSLPPEIEQSNPEELARLVRSWMSEQ